MGRNRVSVRWILTVVLALALFLPVPGLAASSRAPSLEEMAGAMIMVGFHGTTAPASVVKAVSEGRLGGIILFDRGRTKEELYNVESPAQLKKLISSLQSVAPRMLLVAVDQEGGKVCRLKPERGFFALPSADLMGRMSEEEVRVLGFKAGVEMAEIGINVDLAPVVDLRRSRQSPGLGNVGRLFGAGSDQVTRQALAFADGLREAGVLPALKHFPGLGSASKDSHLDLPDVTKTWSEEELLPYVEAFQRGWPGMVLVAHVYHRGLDVQLPASLSRNVVDGLLRRRLGWNGVVVSDDLQMGAVAKGRSLEERVRLAVQAGNDILLFGNNLSYDPMLHEKVFQALMHLVDTGVVSRERLEESWRRIETMKRNAFQDGRK